MTSETLQKTQATKAERIYRPESLKTYRDQRLNVNFMLLCYWLPAYVMDFASQFPTFNGTHIFTDFLSNWGSTCILFYLVAAIGMDLMTDEDREHYKKIFNRFTQIAVVQSCIVTALFWGLIGDKYDAQAIHEHCFNIIVMLSSYFVSEVEFRKRDLPNMWLYGLVYVANTYISYLAGRDGVYTILTWGERDASCNFPLTTTELCGYAIFGGITFIHGAMWALDQLRWKVYERNEKKNQIQLAMKRVGS